MRAGERAHARNSPLCQKLGGNIMIKDDCMNHLLATVGLHCTQLEEIYLSDTSITDVTCALISIFYQSFPLNYIPVASKRQPSAELPSEDPS